MFSSLPFLRKHLQEQELLKTWPSAIMQIMFRRKIDIQGLHESLLTGSCPLMDIQVAFVTLFVHMGQGSHLTIVTIIGIFWKVHQGQCHTMCRFMNFLEL